MAQWGKQWMFSKKTVFLAAFGKCLNLTSAWLLRKCENHMNACALWKVMKSKSMNRCSLLTSKTPFFFSIRSWLMDKNLLPCFFTFFLQFLKCKTDNKLFAQILLHTSSYLELDWEAETNMGIVKTTLGKKTAHGLPLIVNSWESYGSLLIWILVVAILFLFYGFDKMVGEKTWGIPGW